MGFGLNMETIIFNRELLFSFKRINDFVIILSLVKGKNTSSVRIMIELRKNYL